MAQWTRHTLTGSRKVAFPESPRFGHSCVNLNPLGQNTSRWPASVRAIKATPRNSQQTQTSAATGPPIFYQNAHRRGEVRSAKDAFDLNGFGPPAEAMRARPTVRVDVVSLPPRWAYRLKRADARTGAEPRHCRSCGRMRSQGGRACDHPGRGRGWACRRRRTRCAAILLRRRGRRHLGARCGISDRNDYLAGPLPRLRLRIRAGETGFILPALRILRPASAARSGAPCQIVRRRVTRRNRGRAGSGEYREGETTMAKTVTAAMAHAFGKPLKSAMQTLCKQTLTICAGIAIAIFGASPCRAIDYQPFDFVPATPGTIILMGYYEYGTRNQLNNNITGTSKNNTGLQSQIGIFRPLYYNQVLDHPYLLEFLLPFGVEYNGKINGFRLDDASGVSDPILSGTFWPLSRPDLKSWISISDWLSVPIGTYNKDRALNLGANRWQNDVQLDITQGVGEKFTFDVAADWIYYGNNPNAGTGHQTLSQDDTYNVYTWISYDISDVVRHAIPSLGNGTISVGYAGTFGGFQRLDGVVTGSQTHEQQIRFTYQQFVAPTWQLNLSLNHDVSVSGQFKQNFGLLFRVAKIF